MNPRQQKGLEIATGHRIRESPKGFIVPSQSGQGTYLVTLQETDATCTCPDFELQRQRCKHIYAVEYTLTREQQPDGATLVTQITRVTYRQDWPVYNVAQTHERGHFLDLLCGLCDGIVQPPQSRGRPRNLLADIVFSLICKVYSMRSGRRSMSDLRSEDLKRFLGTVPHYNSVFRWLEHPSLTPLLKTLIEESATPLKAVETDFAVDSSGFSTSALVHWYDERYGRHRHERRWVKVHLMCGVHTHIVTSVEVTPTDSADAPQFAGLVGRTARRFPVREVSADKAYLGLDNLQVVDGIDAIAYIPFKQRTAGLRPDALWNRMWHYYMFNRDTFLQHYHKRSNAETTFPMIKGKFGEVVRAKLPVARSMRCYVKYCLTTSAVSSRASTSWGLSRRFGRNRQGGCDQCPDNQYCLGRKPRGASSALTPAPPAHHQPAVVKRVIDGNTLELSTGEKVRLIGVDTPETKDPRKPVEYFGKEATAFTKQLVEDKRIRLEYDQQRRDKYGRTLTYISTTAPS